MPVFERWKAEGRNGAWGFTAASTRAQNLGTLDADIDSPGGMPISTEPPQPRAVVARASDRGVGVMGIRAIAAGALATAIDRSIDPDSAEQRDFDRASAFRTLAAEADQSPAFLAHQDALSMSGVDTLVLGVNNREELTECLPVEAAGPMEPSLIKVIDRAVT